MNNLHPDLFPETLIVDIADGHTFTTSLKVAEHFHRNHKYVLEQIRSLIDLSLSKNGQSDEISLPENGQPNEFSRPNFRPSDEFSALNFEVSNYKNKRGKSYPMYKISRDGFAILAMGFTGTEAFFWKLDFLTAFNLRPKWQPIVLHPDLNRQKLIGLTGHKSPGSITSCRRRMREIGLLPI